jgi:hypothetical protein
MVSAFGSNEVLQPSREWIDALLNYMNGQLTTNGVNDLPAGKVGISWCYDSLNPDHSVIGGVVGLDWTTVDLNKMSYIASSLAPPLDAIQVVIPTAAPVKNPTNAAQGRFNCVQEDFNTLNF